MCALKVGEKKGEMGEGEEGRTTLCTKKQHVANLAAMEGAWDHNTPPVNCRHGWGWRNHPWKGGLGCQGVL